MKEIDISTWERREHFAFFKSIPYPVYNICFDLDITEVKEFTKKENISFNLAMIHVSTSALNRIDNFRYRLRGEQIVLHEILTPSYADIKKDSDLFRMVTVPFENDLTAFERKAKEKADAQENYFVLNDFAGRDDFVFYSAIPWISFTGIDHTINLKREDAIPRISWGKYYNNAGKVLLPYNIQVNHMFVDGYHLGLFKEQLDAIISEIQLYHL